jgi:Domain of unknown function (DUF4292)
MSKYFLIAIISLSLFACKSRKKREAQSFKDFKITAPDVKMGALEGDPIVRQYWTYYTSRAEFLYQDNNQSVNGKVTVRMKKDSIIMFSVRMDIGIEVAKGLITADSAYLLDIIHNDYWVYSTKSLVSKYGAEIGLHELQNLLIGNPVFDTMAYYKDSVTNTFFKEVAPLQNVLYTSSENRIDSSFLTQKGEERQLKCTYSDTVNAGSYISPVNIIFSAIVGDKSAQIEYNIKAVNSATIYNYPFKIPNDATRKSN